MNTTQRQTAIAKRRALVASPVLDHLRRDQTVWSGPVVWDEGEIRFDEMVRELETIRRLGFQIVRFHGLQPVYLGQGHWDADRRDLWMSAAEKAGIGVVLVAEVFDRPPLLLLDEHGVGSREFQLGRFEDPRHREVIRAYMQAFLAPLRGRLVATSILGEPHSTRIDLSDPEERAGFAGWLQAHYRELDALRDAWRVYAGRSPVTSWEDAAACGDPAASQSINGVDRAHFPYGARRDFARYRAEHELARARALAEILNELDPDMVIGVGSHQLFINQAKLGWDIGAWAKVGHLHTTSIHLSWHFDPVAGEVDLPVWLQARMTRDAQKSGFTSAFETTGGAVQFSGGYGNHMDVGLMRRLCFAYLAAGNQSMAFWTWNARPGGWEQGEYGMTGLSGAPMPWAVEAGRIARAMETHRAELWDESAQASVGVLESWDTDAVLLCEPERHDGGEGVVGTLHTGVAGFHRRALIGAGRALTHARIDFEYLTLDEVRSGLAACYDTLLLPWHRAVAPDLFPHLHRYAESGGRLVVDAQFAYCDAHGRLTPRGEGTPLANLLGAWVEVVHDARTGAPCWNGAPVEGFWADVHLTTAECVTCFEDSRPALTRHRIGDGEVWLCAMDPCFAARKPGSQWAEVLLANLCRSGVSDWECTLDQAVRRRTRTADHFFLHNPGPARTVWLQSHTAYQSVTDVLDARDLGRGRTLALRMPAASALWIRAVPVRPVID